MNSSLDDKTREGLQNLIDHNAHSISLWLRKMGLDLDERRAFWLSLAEKETMEVGVHIPKRPKTPVEVVLEVGEGLAHQPGLVRWTRPYVIDLSQGHFPFDFPLNQAQVGELAKAGFTISLLQDGTGFSYTGPSLNGSSEETLTRILSEVLHMAPSVTSREKMYERERRIVTTRVRREDVGTGNAEDESCPT